MQDNENIYDKIKELYGITPDTYSILEEQIDMDVQMSYFEYSRKTREKDSRAAILEKADLIFNEQTTKQEKKEILVQLASVDEVKAFRKIEQYLNEPDSDLRDWAILALKESRMLLESKILDENQIFISTGLGGKGNKLRYFVVLVKNNDNDFDAIQKKIVKTEFEYILNNYNSEIESIQFSENISAITSLVPLQVTVKNVFDLAIAECNKYGDFLYSDFIITNVKKLSFGEIKSHLSKYQ